MALTVTDTRAMAKAQPEIRPLRQRLMWFAALYAAGAAVTLGLSYLLRALLA